MKKYIPKFWNILRADKSRETHIDFLRITYLAGGTICEQSVIIPESSTKEHRDSAIEFIKKWDKNFKHLIRTQIHHYAVDKTIPSGSRISFGVVEEYIFCSPGKPNTYFRGQL